MACRWDQALLAEGRTVGFNLVSDIDIVWIQLGSVFSDSHCVFVLPFPAAEGENLAEGLHVFGSSLELRGQCVDPCQDFLLYFWFKANCERKEKSQNAEESQWCEPIHRRGKCDFWKEEEQ